jgi:DNA-binding SARP family transcriptional activator
MGFGPASPDVSVRTRLTLLGPFRLERGEETLRPTENGCRVLAMLGLRGAMSRSDLAGQLWQDASEQCALGSLRTALWRLRKTAPDLLDASGTYLRLQAGVEVDVTAFAAWASGLLRADPEFAVGPPSVPAGDLLVGWSDDWALLERERLRQLRMHAQEELARWLCRQGRFAEACEAALEAIGLEPLRESAQRTLIAVHLAEQNVIEARRCYETFASALHAELGIPPSEDLRKLVDTSLTSR